MCFTFHNYPFLGQYVQRQKFLTGLLLYQYGSRLFDNISFNEINGYLEYMPQNFVLEHTGFIENVNVKRTRRPLGKQ